MDEKYGNSFASFLKIESFVKWTLKEKTEGINVVSFIKKTTERIFVVDCIIFHG